MVPACDDLVRWDLYAWAVRGALSLPDDVTLVSTGGVGSSSSGYAGVLLGGVEEAFGRHEEELEVFVHCHALDEADVGEDADVVKFALLTVGEA